MESLFLLPCVSTVSWPCLPSAWRHTRLSPLTVSYMKIIELPLIAPRTAGSIFINGDIRVRHSIIISLSPFWDVIVIIMVILILTKPLINYPSSCIHLGKWAGNYKFSKGSLVFKLKLFIETLPPLKTRYWENIDWIQTNHQKWICLGLLRTKLGEYS